MAQQQQAGPVTKVLVGLTCLVFAAEIFFSHNQPDNGIFLMQFGAKFGPLITNGHQYWRLLTPIFLHAGWMHIITNMITLWFIGPVAERDFGPYRFLAIYLGGGVVGNLLSYLCAPLVISVGASSAIFAVFGALLIYTVRRRKNPDIVGQGRILGAFVALNLIVSFTSSEIDLWGHIGGLIGGVALGIGLGFSRRGDDFSPLARGLTLGALLIAVAATIYWTGFA
ncbi:rhomboid family intramembrane serine protease [Lactobacillaceae bacterium L1_55_11]|nr:rhomboid family intramembrane serine protease [Lactobacillaceae bacterium L1_55_11]